MNKSENLERKKIIEFDKKNEKLIFLIIIIIISSILLLILIIFLLIFSNLKEFIKKYFIIKKKKKFKSDFNTNISEINNNNSRNNICDNSNICLNNENNKLNQCNHLSYISSTDLKERFYNSINDITINSSDNIDSKIINTLTDNSSFLSVSNDENTLKEIESLKSNLNYTCSHHIELYLNRKRSLEKLLSVRPLSSYFNKNISRLNNDFFIFKYNRKDLYDSITQYILRD